MLIGKLHHMTFFLSYVFFKGFVKLIEFVVT